MFHYLRQLGRGALNYLPGRTPMFTAIFNRPNPIRMASVLRQLSRDAFQPIPHEKMVARYENFKRETNGNPYFIFTKQFDRPSPINVAYLTLLMDGKLNVMVQARSMLQWPLFFRLKENSVLANRELANPDIFHANMAYLRYQLPSPLETSSNAQSLAIQRKFFPNHYTKEEIEAQITALFDGLAELLPENNTVKQEILVAFHHVYAAVEAGYPDSARTKLEGDIPPEFLGYHLSEIDKALHAAVINIDLSRVLTLLRKGANPNTIYEGHSPLLQAIYQREDSTQEQQRNILSIIKCLLLYGASPQLKTSCYTASEYAAQRHGTEDHPVNKLLFEALQLFNGASRVGEPIPTIDEQCLLNLERDVAALVSYPITLNFKEQYKVGRLINIGKRVAEKRNKSAPSIKFFDAKTEEGMLSFNKPGNAPVDYVTADLITRPSSQLESSQKDDIWNMFKDHFQLYFEKVIASDKTKEKKLRAYFEAELAEEPRSPHVQLLMINGKVCGFHTYWIAKVKVKGEDALVYVPSLVYADKEARKFTRLMTVVSYRVFFALKERYPDINLYGLFSSISAESFSRIDLIGPDTEMETTPKFSYLNPILAEILDQLFTKKQYKYSKEKDCFLLRESLQIIPGDQREADPNCPAHHEFATMLFQYFTEPGFGVPVMFEGSPSNMNLLRAEIGKQIEPASFDKVVKYTASKPELFFEAISQELESGATPPASPAQP